MTRLIALLAAVIASAAAAAAPLALVADVVGTASLQGDRLRLLQEVDAGSVLIVNGGSEVVVFYLADGAQWSLKGAGAYRVVPGAPEATAGAPAPERRPSPAALRDVRVRSDRVTQGGVVLRSVVVDAPTPLSPVAEVVLSAPVRFRWTPLARPAAYAFELVDAAGARIYAGDTDRADLVLPASVTLVPGASYRWSVRARDAAPSRTAEFRYADATTRKRLGDARPPPGAPFAQRVVYVALLEGEGAASEAHELRRTLEAERRVEWAR